MAAALLSLWTAHATTVTFTKFANTDTHATKADTVCVPMPDGKPCGALSCAPPHHDSSPCNITYLEAACIATPHCAGFNTNGWLKSFIGTHEHYNDVDTYVASSVQPGPWKAPTLPPTVPPVPAPTPPFPQKEDWHYPSEENTDAEGALVYGDGLPRISMLVATSNTSGTLTLVRQNGSTAALKRPGDTAFGWTLRCFLVHFDATEGHVRAVVERDFARWGALVYYSIAANTIKPPIIMRKGLGELSAMKRPRYDLAGLSPTYWADTRDDPNDLVKDRAVKASEFGEPTFTAFASLLPPSKDYMEGMRRREEWETLIVLFPLFTSSLCLARLSRLSSFTQALRAPHLYMPDVCLSLSSSSLAFFSLFPFSLLSLSSLSLLSPVSVVILHSTGSLMIKLAL